MTRAVTRPEGPRGSRWSRTRWGQSAESVSAPASVVGAFDPVHDGCSDFGACAVQSRATSSSCTGGPGLRYGHGHGLCRRCCCSSRWPSRCATPCACTSTRRSGRPRRPGSGNRTPGPHGGRRTTRWPGEPRGVQPRWPGISDSRSMLSSDLQYPARHRDGNTIGGLVAISQQESPPHFRGVTGAAVTGVFDARPCARSLRFGAPPGRFDGSSQMRV